MLKRIRDTFKRLIPGIQRILKLVLFLSIITVGIPVIYAMIPISLRPVNVWDFTNTVLLTYIAVHVTFRDNKCTFFED